PTNTHTITLHDALPILFLTINYNYMHQERAHGHAETFSKKSGTLMSTQFIEIGYVKTAKIQVVLYRDLISEQNELAIRFENEYRSEEHTSELQSRENLV